MIVYGIVHVLEVFLNGYIVICTLLSHQEGYSYMYMYM